MRVNDFCSKLLDIVYDYKTLYVMGCFGAPMNDKNKVRYTQNHSYNKKEERKSHILNSSCDTFGFDCVCLIKGILWGWCGDTNHTYGGATYKSNNVPDVSADGFIKLCTNVSSDFSTIKKGDCVWMKGHVGIYVGEGLVVECSPKWENGVQLSRLGNLPVYKKGHYRVWTKKGTIPYLEQDNLETEEPLREYTVKKGDTLWKIASTHLGKGSRYKEIMELNGLKTSTIIVGQKIKMPNI